ncbi:MAG: hypothetical protein R2766_06385 [Saprospiraceae bacterium]
MDMDYNDSRFVTLVSFVWTQYEKVIDLSDYDFEIDEIIEQEPSKIGGTTATSTATSTTDYSGSTG